MKSNASDKLEHEEQVEVLDSARVSSAVLSEIEDEEGIQMQQIHANVEENLDDQIVDSEQQLVGNNHQFLDSEYQHADL